VPVWNARSIDALNCEIYVPPCRSSLSFRLDGHGPFGPSRDGAEAHDDTVHGSVDVDGIQKQVGVDS